MKKKWFSFSNISNAVFVIFFLAMLLVPEVKAWTIQGLMKVGLFQPDVPELSANETVSRDRTAVPGIVFRDQDGNVIDLGNTGGKVVFINFWATWCPPCIAEMPAIAKLHDRFKDDDNVIFVMADMDSNLQKSVAFMKKKGVDLPVHIPLGRIPQTMYSGTLPTTVILDKEGRMVYNHEGTADYSSPRIHNFLKELARRPLQ